MKNINYVDSLDVLGGDMLCLPGLAHHLFFPKPLRFSDTD